MSLADRPCQPCHGDAEAVSATERAGLLKDIPDWKLREEDGVEHLSRLYQFGDYGQAVAFATRVAELAEQEDHHPRLVLEWGKVTVDWWTHTLGGLHINDFILAARCDALYQAG